LEWEDVADVFCSCLPGGFIQREAVGAIHCGAYRSPPDCFLWKLDSGNLRQQPTHLTTPSVIRTSDYFLEFITQVLIFINSQRRCQGSYEQSVPSAS
jgi:hypothetical protein